MLSLSLLSQCCIFVFSCAHSNVVASSCFRGLCCFFLVVRAIDLFLWRFLLLLLVCEFFIQHLLLFCCALGFKIITMFMFHRHGFNVTLACFTSQLFLNYNHCCIINFFSSQMFLHHWFFYITNVLALQLLLHHRFFCIIDVLALQLFLHCWFFYNMESNFFFATLCCF